MSKNLIQGIKNYLANTHRFFNYGSPNVNVLSNLYNATPVEVMTLQNGNVGVGTSVPAGKFHVAGSLSNVVVDSRGYIGIGTLTPSYPFQLISENSNVVINSKGNVGIGTNFPTDILSIGSQGAAFPIPSGNAPLYACRAWVNFGVSGGVVTTYGSGNISSIVRNNLGDFTINFRISMPTANFASVAGYQTGNGRWMWLYNGTFNTTNRSGVTTVSSVRYIYQDNGTSPADPATACVIVIC